MTWQLGPQGIRLDQAWEGIARWMPAIGRYVPYKDSAGKWTIARGHLLTPIELANNVFNSGLTLEECDALFRKDTARYLEAANRAFGDLRDCNQHWIDAGFCFAYNIGVGGFLKSGAVGLIRVGAPFEQIRPRWLEWNKRFDPHTNALVYDDGLHNRRISEFSLFCAPVETPPPAPIVPLSEQERLRMIRSGGQTLAESLKALGHPTDEWMLPGIGDS